MSMELIVKQVIKMMDSRLVITIDLKLLVIVVITIANSISTIAIVTTITD